LQARPGQPKTGEGGKKWRMSVRRMDSIKYCGHQERKGRGGGKRDGVTITYEHGRGGRGNHFVVDRTGFAVPGPDGAEERKQNLHRDAQFPTLSIRACRPRGYRRIEGSGSWAVKEGKEKREGTVVEALTCWWESLPRGERRRKNCITTDGFYA